MLNCRVQPTRFHVLSSGYLPQDWRLARILHGAFGATFSRLSRAVFCFARAPPLLLGPGALCRRSGVSPSLSAARPRVCRLSSDARIRDGQCKRCKVKADIFFLLKSKDIYVRISTTPSFTYIIRFFFVTDESLGMIFGRMCRL